jgi:hypothetical protein
MLHFLGGAVAARRLAVAKKLERTYLLAGTSDKITAGYQEQVPSSQYLVGNTWCIDEQHFVESAAAHSKMPKEIFRTHTQVFM